MPAWSAKAAPTIRSVVLSGHSGGGFAMKTILDSAAGKDLAGVVWFDAVQAQMGPADDRKTTGQRETAKKVINERITAEELAALSQTIHYEVLCGVGARVPRVLARDS